MISFSSETSSTRIAKRVAHEMLQVAHEQVDLHFYMGLGFSIAIIYEEMTGRSAASRKPQELIQWALELPEVAYRRVSL